MSSQACPCCGQPLPATGELRIDPSGVIVRNGRYAVLTRQQFSLFVCLHTNLGRVRSKDQLLADLYWGEAEEPDIKIIDVFVCHLRKKLAPLDVTIQTVWSRGYRLVPAAGRRNAA